MKERRQGKDERTLAKEGQFPIGSSQGRTSSQTLPKNASESLRA